MRPAHLPIGLHLAQVARTVSRAFDDSLAAAGGTLPMWLVLLNIKTRQLANQRELAEAVGIREATLTHHLNAMEADGLITRQRHPDNRRIHVVALTKAGEAAFLKLRDAAIAFDQQLRSGLTESDQTALAALLDRLAGNVGQSDGGLPWAGLAEERP
ncbi:MAG: MarR family transcriptional regulator [Actinobacteria bacterium]|nr:MarR family transcriptional regulator [Actinomycetota bacterium]